MGSLGSNPRTYWSITIWEFASVGISPGLVSMRRLGASYICLAMSYLPISVGKSLWQLWSFGSFLFSTVSSQPGFCLTGVCVPQGDWQSAGGICSPEGTSEHRLSGCPIDVSTLLFFWLFLRPSGFAAVTLFLYPGFICSVFPLRRTRLLPSKMARYSFNSNIYWVPLSIRLSARYHEGQAHTKTLCLHSET